MKKWGETADGKIEFITLPVEDAKAGIVALREGFFTDENVCIACEVSANPAACQELEALCLEAARDGISILARDKETKKCAGVCYNKIQIASKPGEKGYFEIFRDTKCKERESIALMNLMIHVDSLVDTYGIYNADCSLELMFLATHPDYRRRGVATGLVKHSIELGKTLKESRQKDIPQITTAIFSAIGSYRVGQILGFDELKFVKWNEVEYNGVTYDKKIDCKTHPGLVLMAKRL